MSVVQWVKQLFVVRGAPLTVPDPIIFYIVFASALVFTILYQLCDPMMKKMFPNSYGKLDEDHRIEWNSRILSNVHAIVVVIYCVYIIFNSSCTEKYLHDIDVIYGCEHSLYVLSISLGYFLYDTVIILMNYNQLGGASMMFHHISSIACICILNSYRQFTLIPLSYCLTEITTPFVNQRFFFDKAEKKNSKRYTFNGLLMWLGFVLFRCTMIPLSVYIVYTKYDVMREKMPIFLRYCLYAQVINISVLNLFWTYKITMGIVSTLIKRSKHTKTKSQ
ncbi:tmem56b [Acrasis kona]|uniref:Tmem56b n=1 Tax=Acrasis kona TaxID=1008807 RepID=A0AAW2Z8I0_9EUKA